MGFEPTAPGLTDWRDRQTERQGRGPVTRAGFTVAVALSWFWNLWCPQQSLVKVDPRKPPKCGVIFSSEQWMGLSGNSGVDDKVICHLSLPRRSHPLSGDPGCSRAASAGGQSHRVAGFPTGLCLPGSGGGSPGAPGADPSPLLSLPQAPPNVSGLQAPPSSPQINPQLDPFLSRGQFHHWPRQCAPKPVWDWPLPAERGSW